MLQRSAKRDINWNAQSNVQYPIPINIKYEFESLSPKRISIPQQKQTDKKVQTRTYPAKLKV